MKNTNIISSLKSAKWLKVGIVLIMQSYSITLFAQPKTPTSIVALSKTDHTLAIVDLKTFKVTAKIPVGLDPHEVVVTPDGKTAYVSNTGSGKYHEINIIDLANLKASGNINTEPLYGPHGLAFTGGKLWFTTQGSKTIGRYNPYTSNVEWSVGTGQDMTHMLYVTKDTSHIYTTNVQSGTISIFDHVLLPPTITPMGYALPTAKPYLDWKQTVIAVAARIEGFDVTPDEKYLWAADPAVGSLYVIDLAEKKIINKIDAGMPGANRVKITPDGKRVLVSSLKTGDLFIFDKNSQKQLAKINLGHGCAHILVEANGSRAFVACTPDNYIAVVDLKTYKVAAHIDIGGRPDGMAFITQE